MNIVHESMSNQQLQQIGDWTYIVSTNKSEDWNKNNWEFKQQKWRFNQPKYGSLKYVFNTNV